MRVLNQAEISRGKLEGTVKLLSSKSM